MIQGQNFQESLIAQAILSSSYLGKCTDYLSDPKFSRFISSLGMIRIFAKTLLLSASRCLYGSCGQTTYLSPQKRQGTPSVRLVHSHNVKCAISHFAAEAGGRRRPRKLVLNRPKLFRHAVGILKKHSF